MALHQSLCFARLLFLTFCWMRCLLRRDGLNIVLMTYQNLYLLRVVYFLHFFWTISRRVSMQREENYKILFKAQN